MMVSWISCAHEVPCCSAASLRWLAALMSAQMAAVVGCEAAATSCSICSGSSVSMGSRWVEAVIESSTEVYERSRSAT